MKKILTGIASIALLIGAVMITGAAVSAGAATIHCGVSHDGTQLCASSVQDVQVQIAANNMAVALGTLGAATTTPVRFDAPSRNACLQVGRAYGDTTKYLGNYTCLWTGAR